MTPAYLQVIYWLSTPLLAVLAVLFLARRLYRDFPVFFSYVVVACLSDISRFVAYRVSFRTYTNTFWISQLLNTILAVGAIGELFLKRIFPQFHKIRFYRYLFSVAATIVIVLATLTSLDTIGITVLTKTIRVLDFIRVSTLSFFVVLMLFMGRAWGRYEFGIALGFAVDAAAFLATFALDLRRYFHGGVVLLPVIAYDLACVIWLFCFIQTEKSGQIPQSLVSSKVITEARQWEETLKESISGKKRND